MRRGLAYWIWAFFAICLPLQKAGLFASDPDVKSLQCRHCMLPYRHQCHKMKIVAWYHDTNICGKAKQAACYDLPFWALSARRTAEQQHDATSLNSLWVSLWFSPKSTCCRQNSIAAKWNIFLSFGLKVPLRFSMGGNQSPGGKLSQRMSESMRLIKSRRMTVESNSSQHIDLHRYSQSSWQLVYSWNISPWCRNSFIIWWLNLAGASGSEFLVVQVLCSGRRFFAKVN